MSPLNLYYSASFPGSGPESVPGSKESVFPSSWVIASGTPQGFREVLLARRVQSTLLVIRGFILVSGLPSGLQEDRSILRLTDGVIVIYPRKSGAARKGYLGLCLFSALFASPDQLFFPEKMSSRDTAGNRIGQSLPELSGVPSRNDRPETDVHMTPDAVESSSVLRQDGS